MKGKNMRLEEIGMDNKEILKLKFKSTDLGKEITIKDFFKELLITLFKEGECFSGKRPFGNSGWDYDLCVCLVQNGVIEGSYFDNCSFTDWEYDSAAAESKILDLIKEL
jgi:hypothetical protein